MGEAKRRKLEDAWYGRIPKRGPGLILSNPVKIDNDGIEVSSGIDPLELRFSLLFWDRLVWPKNTFVDFGADDDSEYLMTTGIMKRPKYDVGGAFGDVVAEVQLKAFHDLNAREPGLWSFAQGERTFLDLRKHYFESNKGFSYELTSAIPVPDFSAPIADILEFKERRRDQLLELRVELDSFSRKIEKGGDREADYRAAVNDIERACINALKVSRESGLPFRLANTKVSYNVKLSDLIGAGLAAMAAKGSGLPNLWAVIAGLGEVFRTKAVEFHIEGDVGLADKRLATHPYRFVASFHEEVVPRS